ncbi:hypothetical protein GR157_30245 [Burkholderia sp. 4701]|nr:hypothetical protein [Burkholderia sp. 4701]MXN83390.1 hypothetical protein [Burkholderia sp. 4812]
MEFGTRQIFQQFAGVLMAMGANMSYEYSIKLHDVVHNADSVLSELRRSQLVVYEKGSCIAFKDPESLNTWAYDLRIFKMGGDELLLEITNSTNDLYGLVRSALPPSKNYSLTEVEDEDELSLEQAFRLR